MLKLKAQNHNLKLKTFFKLLLVACYLLLVTPAAFASEYVLPYPSYMPGHKLYKVRLVWEKIQEYWCFGSIAKFKFHLSMSDKYLVEAKTLFEYKQYLLAVNSLKKSNENYKKGKKYLEQAEREGKDITQKKQILYNAREKHREVLNRILNKVPKKVEWKEENKKSVKLNLHKELMKL
jgi:ribosomal protein L24E